MGRKNDVGMPSKGARHFGFTLIELMVSIAVLVVLISIAAPSYRRLVIDTRMATQANELLTSLQFTRSEAVKRNGTVTMCKSSDGAACATSGTWAQGWIVFVDDGVAGTVDGGDTVLRVHAALTDGSTLAGSGGVADFVSYLPNGLSAQTGQFDLCSADTSYAGRDIVLSLGSGAASSTVDEPTCG
jgi:type IV fimbrial biogenesis protein FimT